MGAYGVRAREKREPSRGPQRRVVIMHICSSAWLDERPLLGFGFGFGFRYVTSVKRVDVSMHSLNAGVR